MSASVFLEVSFLAAPIRSGIRTVPLCPLSQTGEEQRSGIAEREGLVVSFHPVSNLGILVSFWLGGFFSSISERVCAFVSSPVRSPVRWHALPESFSRLRIPFSFFPAG